MKLTDIKESDFDFIYSLTSNQDVIKHIENGKLWDKEKTKTFIEYSLEEQKIPNKNRFHYYYIISDKNKQIGIIGFFKEKDKNYYLRIFLDPQFQGQGYFTKSLNIIKERLLKYKNVEKLYADVHQTNEKMNIIMRNKFFFNKVKYYGKIAVNQYIIFLRNYTYLVKSDYIPEKVIDKFFKDRGNWIKHNPKSSIEVDYIRLDGKHYYDKNNRKYKSILKNIVNDGKKKLDVKSNLIKTLGKKHYLPTTYIFDHQEEFEKIKQKLISNERAWIFKPDGGYSGKGIEIYRKKDFEKIKINPKYKRWNLQEYIENPMLIDGKKFHLRVLFLYRAGYLNKPASSFWFKHIPIYLAKKKFKYDDFNDEDVHISHYQTDQEALYFQDLNLNKNQMVKILKDIKLIMIDLANNLKAGCYKNDCLRCYEIFGVDLMITDDYKVKLIEFNSKIGLKEFTNDEFKFNQHLLQAELELTADYFLPSKNKLNKEKNDFILIN